MNIAILGGTGKEGAGLAARWARVGHSIIIGSRDPERAKTKAAELRELTHKLPIIGESNAEAARLGTVIVVALPAQGLAATLPEVRDGCRLLRRRGADAPAGREGRRRLPPHRRPRALRHGSLDRVRSAPLRGRRP